MIRFEQLRKEYDELVAVNDINVVIPAGEIYGLIGPNGAGKTSTIRMACGLLTPTSGKVYVNDVDVHAEPERAQEHIGYLSDFFSVYDDLKVWEYLDYFAHAYRMPEAAISARIDEVIAQVGLEVKRDSMIKGLSRGMKQRLGIARAVIHKPKVLLLDEPASGLDPKARMELRNLLRSLQSEGTTILISSHILPDLEGFCTSIGIMEKGSMVRSGRLDQITAQEMSFRTIRIAWIGGSGAIAEHLRAARVEAPVLNSKEGMFKFSGSDEELAQLLHSLVSAGIRLTHYGEVRHTVEDIYVKVSHQEVS